MSNSLPDNSTSDVSIRTFSFKQLEHVKAFAESLNRKSKEKCSQKGKIGPESQSSTGKRPFTEREKLERKTKATNDNNPRCEACHITYKEDDELGLCRVWVQCNVCQLWMQTEYLGYEIDENDIFLCPKCYKN